MKERVAIFGGAFDPPHRGHLNLCKSILEILQPDRLIIFPNHGWLDQGAVLRASFSDRLEMTKLAFLELKGVFKKVSIEVSSYEGRTKGPSYTINTVEMLESKDRKLYLLLSEEKLSELASWYRIDDLLKKVEPIFILREKNFVFKEENYNQKMIELYKKGYFKSDVCEISSSEIREWCYTDRQLNEKRLKHFLEIKVLDYIKKHQLYSHA